MPLAVDDHRPTIELYGTAGDASLWDQFGLGWDDPDALWADEATAVVWHPIACQVSAFTSRWGSDEPTGVLAQSAAGVLTLETYDPDRLLDPSNESSAYRKAARIGSPIRLTLAGVGVLGYGYLDEIEFDYATSTGRLTAADEIATLAQALTPADFWQPVNSLRALAVATIAAAGQTVPVGAAPAGGDPVIAYVDTRAKPAYAIIRDAALDGLCLAWIDRQTVPPSLQFSWFAYATDRGLRLGDGGIPLAELTATGGAAGVVNVVDDETGELARALTGTGRDQAFSVSRIEPAGVNWAGAILADRWQATLSLVPGDVYPRTLSELAQLATVRGMEACRIVLIAQPIDALMRVTGAELAGEAGGVYRARLSVYSPGDHWTYTPPPPASVAATPSSRTFAATKDASIFFGGALAPGTIRSRGWGLGPMRVGREGGPFTYAALLAFDPMTWTGVRRVRKIELVLVYDAAGVGSPVAALVQRIAAPWSEGRGQYAASSTTFDNAVVWPGPAVDAETVPVTLTATGAGAEQRIDITAIALPTLPIGLGGRGYPDFGYRVTPATGSAGGSTVAPRAKESVDDEPTAIAYCRLEVTVEV